MQWEWVAGGTGLLVGGGVGLWIGRQKAALDSMADVPTRTKQSHTEERAFSIEMYKVGQATYDKLIPWASGGALLFSITLIDKLTCGHPVPGSKGYIVGGWILLLASLLSAIIGHYASAWTYFIDVDLLDAKGRTRPLGLRDYKRRRWWREGASKVTTVLNAAAGLTLVLGFAAVAIFASLNTDAREESCKMAEIPRQPQSGELAQKGMMRIPQKTQVQVTQPVGGASIAVGDETRGMMFIPHQVVATKPPAETSGGK